MSSQATTLRGRPLSRRRTTHRSRSSSARLLIRQSSSKGRRRRNITLAGLYEAYFASHPSSCLFRIDIGRIWVVTLLACDGTEQDGHLAAPELASAYASSFKAVMHGMPGLGKDGQDSLLTGLEFLLAPTDSEHKRVSTYFGDALTQYYLHSKMLKIPDRRQTRGRFSTLQLSQRKPRLKQRMEASTPRVNSHSSQFFSPCLSPRSEREKSLDGWRFTINPPCPTSNPPVLASQGNKPSR
ncbi:hypothetical protein J3F83DRAFT_332517 [Trichoderma novae-zelandiae]